MAAHRYWRIYITAAIGTPHLDISEIEMRTAFGGADQCSGGVAIKSNETAGFEASKAFDNTTATTWYISQASFPLPQWIGYDFGLGVTKDIKQVALTCWNAVEMVKTFDIQWSDDAVSWTTYYSVVNETGWTTGETRNFPLADPTAISLAKATLHVASGEVDAVRITKGTLHIISKEPTMISITKATLHVVSQGPLTTRRRMSLM